MSAALERFAGLLKRAGKRVTRRDDRLDFQCPLHDDHTPSASATVGDSVPVVAHCQACDEAADLPTMLEELGASHDDRDLILGGKPSRDGERKTRYPIRDAAGNLVATHVRIDHANGEKDYPWERDGKSGLSGLPTTSLPLYGAELVSGWPASEPVLVVEGEKAADALRRRGFNALGTVTGAKSTPGGASLEVLRGRDVILWPDADEPGRVHMRRISAQLAGVASSVHTFTWPEAPEKGDAADYFTDGRTPETLQAALDAARVMASAQSRTTDRLIRSSLSGPGILAHPFERRTPLLGAGIIAAGDLVLIFGRAKSGKTWITLQLALAMARGEPWFGIPTTSDPVAVGFLELELLGDSMQDRLRALTDGDIPERLHLVVRPALRGAFDLVDKQGVPVHLDELRAWVEERGLKVVFVDALARATSCDQVDFSPLLLALDHLRADLGVCIILIHHEGKPSRSGHGEADDLDAMRGDSRLSAFPQAILRVVKKAGNLHAVRFAGVSNGPAPDPIYFTLDPATGVPRPTQAPESVARGNRERVLNVVLGAAGPLSCGEVAKLTSLSDAAARKHLGTLCDEGQIGRTGENRGTRYHSATRLPATPAMLDGVAGVSVQLASRWGDE